MSAELFTGDVLQITLRGRSQNRVVLEQLLGEAEGVSGYAIDESGVLTAWIAPGHGELDVVRALLAAGMYPLETLDADATIFGGGPRAC